jgi:hypothetical protein
LLRGEILGQAARSVPAWAGCAVMLWSAAALAIALLHIVALLVLRHQAMTWVQPKSAGSGLSAIDSGFPAFIEFERQATGNIPNPASGKPAGGFPVPRMT